MGSVYARWSGRCGDPAVRRDLLAQVEDLAEISHSYFDDPPQIRRFHGTIRGRILISPAVLEGTELEMPAAAHAPGGLQLQVAGPLNTEKPAEAQGFLTVSQAWLEGIEFRLYDGRVLYPNEDRVSFVFASFAEYPTLDGTLVYVEDREECLKYRNEAVHDAHYLLTDPNIHLRYFYEEWMDLMIGWVKHFHLPELRYWRYEPMAGCERYHGVPRDPETRDTAWEMLKAAFGAEVRDKREEAAGVRAFWDMVRRQ
jgi:hypothetical protein